jgi:mono/diheme cytochrome c family protein
VKPRNLAFVVALFFSMAAAVAARSEQKDTSFFTPPPPVIFSATDRDSGQALFTRNCAVCHAPGGSGALALAKRLGPQQALLTDRRDLTSELVTSVARNGIGSMPPISAGSLSDKELKAIASYLARRDRKSR